MQDHIRAVGRRLDPHLTRGGMKQGQDLGRTAAHVFVRLLRRLAGRLPARPRLRDGLERPGLILAPDRQTQLRAERVGPLDQLFFAVASGSVTATTPPCLDRRMTVPVAHQVRLFCQLRPAACSVCQIV